MTRYRLAKHVTMAGLVGANHGITLDPIFDLARVLRLPGTVNAKYRPHSARRAAARNCGAEQTREREDRNG